MLKFLPDAPVRWRDAFVGGIVAAVLFSAGKKLFALYLAHAGMANSFGAAGSLAVLLMWLYFSAVVLLLGAEFSAARGRLNDPRGAWAFLKATPPGSRAMMASVLAASTVGANPAHRASPDRLHNESRSPASASVVREVVREEAPNPIDKAVAVGRSVMRAETRATRAAAVTLVQAGRTAVAADRYVRRHPWGSVLLGGRNGHARGRRGGASQRRSLGFRGRAADPGAPQTGITFAPPCPPPETRMQSDSILTKPADPFSVGRKLHYNRPSKNMQHAIVGRYLPSKQQ